MSSAIEQYMERTSGSRIRTGTAADDVDTDPADPGELYDQATGRTSSSSTRTPSGKITSGADSNRQRAVREAATRPEAEVVGAPPAVDKSWGEVVKAKDAAQAAERDWLKAQHAQERARKAAHDAIAEQVAKTGKAPSEAGQRKAAEEFAADLDRKHAIWAGLANRVGKARAAYDAEVVEHRDGWAEDLLAEVGPRRAATVTALRSALSAVSSLDAVVSSARTHHSASLRAAGAEGLRGISPFNPHKVGDAISDALAAIEGDEPWTLVDVPVNGLSMHERALMAQESSRGTLETARRRWLDEVEKSERYTVTKDGKPVTKSA